MSEIEKALKRKKRKKNKNKTQINSLALASIGVIMIVYFAFKIIFLLVQAEGFPGVNLLTVEFFYFHWFEGLIFIAVGLALVVHGLGFKKV